MDKIEELLQKIKENKWFDNHEKLDDDIKLFDTRMLALSAAWPSANGAALNFAAINAWAAAEAAAKQMNVDNDYPARARKICCLIQENPMSLGASPSDVILYAYCLMTLPPDSPHRIHAKKRADIWLDGYGVMCDVNGVLYAYKGRE